MPSDLAAANAVLKVGYENIHEQLESRLIALKMIESGADHLNFDGVEAQFAIHTGRNEGVGARGEYEDLPEPGQNTDARASVFMKYQYAAIQATGQVMKQVTGASTAFVNWVEREMNTIIESANRDLSRQVYGDGTGTLAVLTASATGATSVTVDDTRFLQRNMLIHVLTQATLGNPTPTQGNSAVLKITAIDAGTNVVTFSGGTVTAATGSVLVRGGATTNSWKKEWEGLGLIVSYDKTLHGINPTTEPEWRSAYIENNVGTLAEVDFDHAIDKVYQEGASITDVLTTPGVARAYWNTLQGLRQFNGNEQMTGGVKTPALQSTHGNFPITQDWQAPTGVAYFFNRKDLFLHRSQDWHWIDETGSKWQQLPNKDAFIARIRQYSNIGSFRRNSTAKLTGITEL